MFPVDPTVTILPGWPKCAEVRGRVLLVLGNAGRQGFGTRPQKEPLKQGRLSGFVKPKRIERTTS